MKKKLIAMLLAFAILFNTSMVYASTSSIEKGNVLRTNVVDIKITDTEMIYSYDEDGKSYYIEEYLNPEMTEVHSKLFIVENNEKIFYKNIDSYIDSKTKDIKVYENGVLTIDLKKEDYFIESTQIETFPKFIEESVTMYDDLIKPLISDIEYNYDKYPQYNWHRQTASGTTIVFPRLTKAAIAAALAANAGIGVGAIAFVATFFHEGGYEKGYRVKESYLNLDYDRHNPNAHPFYKFRVSYYPDPSKSRVLGRVYTYQWR